MHFNFELFLFYAVLITGLITLADWIFFSRGRKRKGKVKMPVIIDYARSFFPILLIVFLLRSFLYEPFRIPTGSLEPTLLAGDFILVNKFDYGVRLPVIHTKLWGQGKPQRGDIIVFRYPEDPSLDYIKRVIGLPGDFITYRDKVLSVNGKEVPQTGMQKVSALDENGEAWQAMQKQEDLLGVKHEIYLDDKNLPHDFYNIQVPEGQYFVMGDNRDHSADSRYWGYVPDKNIVGKAVLIWMSWNSQDMHVRWKRIGKVIH